MATPQTVAFHTLGCKLNFSETSGIRRNFERLGYATVDWEDPADIYVLNTCSVTDFADRKCRAAVRKALRQRPEARIVVIGCYAQLKPEEIANIEGVDLVLGAAEKFNVHHYVDSISKAGAKAMVRAGDITELSGFESSFSFGDRTRSFLKIQDGCDYKCSFCTIPQARGHSRSDSIANVLEKAREIGESGIKEIVLTGVNIGDFGLGQEGSDAKSLRNENFYSLVRALDQVSSIERFRISSIEPNLCSNEIIRFVAGSERFAPHFHMPLQSGSDRILAMMRRRYRRKLYAERVQSIKECMPHACIGADVIVGFPGETDEDFRETFDFISDLDVSYLHVFTYSERANTPAAEMECPVPMHVRRQRNEILRNLSEKKRMNFYNSFIGSQREVLLEHSKKKGYLSGYTDNYIRIEIPRNGSGLQSNTVRPLRLTDWADKECLHAEEIFS